MQDEFRYMTKRHKLAIFICGTILVLAGILIAIYATKMSATDKIADIKERKYITIVTENSIWGYSDKLKTGFSYEIAQAFADSLGVELKVKIVNDATRQITCLEKGECDIVAQLLPITTAYKNVAYTTPFFSSWPVLVQRKNAENSISAQSQLADKTIFISDNQYYKMRIKHLSDEIAADIHISEIPDVTTDVLINMLDNENINYTVCTELQARFLKKQYENLDFSLPIGFNQQYAWVINTDAKDLGEALNDFLNAFTQTIEYRTIYIQYFN